MGCFHALLDDAALKRQGGAFFCIFGVFTFFLGGGGERGDVSTKAGQP